MDRVWQLEKEHFGSSTDYVFMPITRIVTLENDPTAMHPEVQLQVGRVRTDMDRFSNREIQGLVRHSYCVARQAIASRPCLSAFKFDGPPWDPITQPTSPQQSVATPTSCANNAPPRRPNKRAFCRNRHGAGI